MDKFDIIVVGAGISGAVMAERCANIGKKVLVLEKRNHIAGNCHDYYNSDGILVSGYGAHIFHTNHEMVWKYVNQFSEFHPYEHRVLARVDNLLVPVPVNITTVNTIFGLSIGSESEMDRWLQENQIPCDKPSNGREAALSRVGETLYRKLFESYTKKQWNRMPEEMDPSVLNRIPVRNNFDDRYFSDRYQALPVGGYTRMFRRILSHPNIRVLLNTDYFSVRNQLKPCEKLFYTGPIDDFFDFKEQLGTLEYRSIRFAFETYEMEWFQENSVINYPAADIPFTRIIEFRHFTKQQHPKTTVCREYSIDAGTNGEKYYPVPCDRNHRIYAEYQKAAEALKGIHFLGRLANYRYFNMDEAFKNALELFGHLYGGGAN